MSRSNKSKYNVEKEIGPLHAYVNSKWTKNFLNRKQRHDWQETVKIELSYGFDDWVDDYPSIWDDDFDDYDVRPFKVMRDAG